MEINSDERLSSLSVLQELTVSVLELFEAGKPIEDFLGRMSERLGLRAALLVREGGDGFQLWAAAGLGRSSQALPLRAAGRALDWNAVAWPYPELAGAGHVCWAFQVLGSGEGLAETWLLLFFNKDAPAPDAYRGMLALLASRLKKSLLYRDSTERIEERVLSRTAELVEAKRLIGESETRYRALIDNMKAGVLVEAEDRSVLTVNQAFRDLFGAASPMHGAAAPEAFAIRVQEIIAAGRTVLDEEIALADGRVCERDYVRIFSSGGGFIGHMW